MTGRLARDGAAACAQQLRGRTLVFGFRPSGNGFAELAFEGWCCSGGV